MLTRSCVQVIVLEELFDHVEVGRDHHGSVAHVEPDQGAVLFNLLQYDKVYFELVGSMGHIIYGIKPYYNGKWSWRSW